MSIEHIPITSQDSEQVAVPVEVQDKLVTDPGQAEHMAYIEGRIRDTVRSMGETAARRESYGSEYYDIQAKAIRKEAALIDEMMSDSVDYVGEDYRALMDIVDEIRSRAEGASAPHELEAKEKMEEALQRAMVAGGLTGASHTILMNPKSFASLPDIRIASGYAERASGRR